MKYDMTHARHDPVHCLTPGLFRSLQKGERKKAKLHIIYEYGEGQKIEFRGFEPLGADDLRVLQGLVALSGPEGLLLSPEPKTEEGKQLRSDLYPRWEAVRENALVIKSSHRRIAKEIGYSNTNNFKVIRDCIDRLWAVAIIAEDNGVRRGFKLLSHYNSDEKRGNLFVALNPMIAQAVMGRRHVHISMDEVRNLKSDCARLIHQRLCAWINPNQTKVVSLDVLSSYAWPIPASPSTNRKRRQRSRTALNEFVALGWTVEEVSTNKFAIKRPPYE